MLGVNTTLAIDCAPFEEGYTRLATTSTFSIPANAGSWATFGERARLWAGGTVNAVNRAVHEQVKEATGGKGVDLIVDMVSGGAANRNLEAAALLGRIVNVGRLGGMSGDFNFDLHALKRIDYIGVTFRTRTLEEIREITRLMRADLLPAVETGKLSLPIYATYPLDDIADQLILRNC
jgi:NADPH:quinone reductase